MCDRSTRNSSIERLWVKVGIQFACHWWGFFMRLKQLHKLDINKPGHHWLLGVLFLNALNDDFQSPQVSKYLVLWNYYLITMKDMSLLGQASLGIYEDEFQGICPAVLQRYYGIYGREMVHCYNQTGAGHPIDEVDELEEDSIIDHIE
ncbi:hypothetical protein F4604DRAFT_1570554 [Suillus subluteus]|nr:hypothetical protein F4604DRAFT_1570554 [Suillus subluteus]